MPEKLLTVKEAADFLGVSEAEIENMVARGTLPAYKVGGKFLRFRKEQLEAVTNELSLPKIKREKEEIPESLMDKVLDFLYFKDFYIISCVVILAILWVIFRL